MIRVLLLALLLSGCSSMPNKCETAYPFFKVGAGYKYNEFDIKWSNKETGEITQIGQNPLAARVEMGFECENFIFGYHHQSDFFSGYPFDDVKREYYKDELFIDYKWKFSPVKF